MRRDEPPAPIHPAGEGGSGTVPGDRIGTSGPASDQFGVPEAPPRTPARGTYQSAPAAAGAADPSSADDEVPRSGAMGDTQDVRTVVPEARHGVDYGSPSGGVAGGTSAQRVAEETDE